MSEDAHNSDNDPVDPTVCCIFGCMEPSTVYLDNNWYCDFHGKEYETSRDTCAEPGCGEAGVVSSSNTHAKFCITHAWKQDRTVDDNGLSHPGPAESSPKIPMVPTVPTVYINYVEPKKFLEDEGTRFRHIADFQEYISSGIEAVTNSIKKYKNENDLIRLVKLEACLKFVEIYMETLSGFDNKKWDLNNLLDKCVPSRDVLSQIKADKEHEIARGKAEHERNKTKDKESGSR